MRDQRIDHTTSNEIMEADDIALIELARAGSRAAFGELYVRHEHAALRLARHLGGREESEDIVAESFAQVLDLLRRGRGPERSFRAYLNTAVRHEAGRRSRADRRVRPTDDLSVIDSSVELGNGDLDGFERATVRAAYESLPDRWRSALWHLDVEGRKPHELADVLGVSPNAVSALVYRARSGLREAYLQQHVNTEPIGGSYHLDVRASFAAVLRRTAPAREQEKVHAHLADCAPCLAAYVEVAEVAAEVA